MNRRALILALALATAPMATLTAQVPTPNTDPAALPAGTYVLDKTHAAVIGRVSHFGLALYTFRFDGLDGSFTYDPKNPTAAKINIAIDANSMSTGSEEADKKFPTQFLAADKHPKITFVSTGIVHTGPTGKVTGDLTMGGVTKPVVLDVVYRGHGSSIGPVNRAGFSAKGVVKRSDFGLTAVPRVGDEVQLDIEVEFERK